MPTYVYRCTGCGESKEYPTTAPEAHGRRWHNADGGCGAVMRRDWKAEGAKVNIANLKRDREAGK